MSILMLTFLFCLLFERKIAFHVEKTYDYVIISTID